MTKKGVKFAEHYFIKQEKNRKFKEDRKYEEDLKEDDLRMKYNYVEVKEEDEYLSSVLVMEVKDRNSEESEEAIKEELTRLEEECIGEGLEEWNVRKVRCRKGVEWYESRSLIWLFLT